MVNIKNIYRRDGKPQNFLVPQKRYDFLAHEDKNLCKNNAAPVGYKPFRAIANTANPENQKVDVVYVNENADGKTEIIKQDTVSINPSLVKPKFDIFERVDYNPISEISKTTTSRRYSNRKDKTYMKNIGTKYGASPVSDVIKKKLEGVKMSDKMRENQFREGNGFMVTKLEMDSTRRVDVNKLYPPVFIEPYV